MKADIIIRQANEEDLPFILNSWLISYYAGSELDEKIDSAIYYCEQTKLIEEILSQPAYNKVFVASLPDHPRQILGWVCYAEHQDAIHYIYVKHTYRRFGIATLLFKHCSIDDSPEWATHYTRISKILLPKWNLKYNPYILYESI